MVIFRNKTNISIIKGFRVTTIIENMKGIVGDVNTYYILISLEKLCTQPIRAGQGHYCL
jgi:hypothetical protein